MANTITDEMLEHFALVATWDDMAAALGDRYGDTAARVVTYLTEEQIAKDPSALPKWGEIATAVRSA